MRAQKRVKREHVVPGQILVVKPRRVLTLDPHLMLSGKSWDMLDGGVLHVVSKPRKIDGINLVRVQVNQSEQFECYYCDILSRCELQGEQDVGCKA